MNAESIYRVLKQGTPAERQALVRSLPPNPLTDAALSLVGSDNPGMVVVSLGPAVINYCNGSAPEVGVELAQALHRYAVELFDGTTGHGLLTTTLTNFANSYVKALNLLGRSQEVVTFADKYIPFYQNLNETTNLPSLKLARITALLNLKRVDDAAAALEDPTLAGNPASDIELERLRGRVRDLRAPITADRSAAPASAGPASDDFVARAQAALKEATAGMPDLAGINALIDKLGAAPRADPRDPAGFAHLLDVIKMGESFLRGASTGDSELSIRGRIREASGIFALETQPAPERIRASLAELEDCLEWAHANKMMELENDALYGIYLCHSRLKAPSPAANALLRLRRNLEDVRNGITDVVKRGGAFSLYPYLFAGLCEKLCAAGRLPELLEAIDASKGRGVADLLTRRAGTVVSDAAIYGAAARVPALCRQYAFSYVTYFVDDECVYAVLVTRDGRMHAPTPVPLSREAIRQATSPVTPGSAELLAPLVAWLDPFVDDGSIAPGSHVCIAADDDLANVPFGLLPLAGRPMAETLSTSRIHNAYHLAHVLESSSRRPTGFVGVVVPTRQNIASPNWTTMRANLLKPIESLAEVLPGETLEETSASPATLTTRDLSERVVHFSTHGLFSKTEAPFDHSGLLLTDGGTLPDGAALSFEAVLTPRTILDRELNLSGSHVSMMACVSGLSREGVGGDALGMEWAMIQAGATSVLSSHWDVSARHAARFLSAFYEQWLGKQQSRATALSTTISSLKAEGGRGAEAVSWAAFSLTGDWR